MEIDPFVLASIQFAANISFHIIFPGITIGLCWFLFFFRIRYTFTGDKAWEFACFSWVKIFALTFALGVVSDIFRMCRRISRLAYYRNRSLYLFVSVIHWCA